MNSFKNKLYIQVHHITDFRMIYMTHLYCQHSRHNHVFKKLYNFGLIFGPT
jgi:hypothetical protein